MKQDSVGGWASWDWERRHHNLVPCRREKMKGLRGKLRNFEEWFHIWPPVTVVTTCVFDCVDEVVLEPSTKNWVAWWSALRTMQIWPSALDSPQVRTDRAWHFVIICGVWCGLISSREFFWCSLKVIVKSLESFPNECSSPSLALWWCFLNLSTIHTFPANPLLGSHCVSQAGVELAILLP